MTNSSSSNISPRPRPKMPGAGVSIEHYWRLILHRKWVVLAVFLTVTGAVAVYARRLPNIYSSETTILVDPQKVPESYVKSTVTGDIRNRLGNLSNQILSATQLQKIIEALNLYPEERKRLPREDVILKMRGDINTSIMTDFGGSQDLQAFKIVYSGRDPRMVAQVTNRLASLFIDENWKTRELQATGTTEFLENQVQETKKELEKQEAQIRDFKLKHIGEMPEQQTSALTMLGQLQAQLQLDSEALNRAETTKNIYESMLTQAVPTVVDMDPPVDPKPAAAAPQSTGTRSRPVDPLAADRAELSQKLARYGPKHPDVIKLQSKIALAEVQAKVPSNDNLAITVPVPPPPTKPVAELDPAPSIRTAPATSTPVQHFNPVIQSQIKSTEAEIARLKDEKQRLTKQLDSYRSRLDAIPLREQEISSLTRDYEMSRAHYSQLLDRKMNAETATELEVRQKGEKFEVIDPAMPAEKPARPNRKLLNMGGAIAGLVLGLLAALGTELLGMSITDSQDVLEAGGVAVLGVIPVILTQSEKTTRRRRMIMAAASATFAAMVIGAILFLKVYNPA